MKTYSDWIQQFKDQVNTTHIKYDRDGGHSYSYIEHPLMDDLDNGTLSVNDTLLCQEHSDEWLYENDNCPPCELEIKDGKVSSGCGCHDHLDYELDKEEVEEIIGELMTNRIDPLI